VLHAKKGGEKHCLNAGLVSGSQVCIHSVSEQDQNTWLSHNIDYMCVCCQNAILCIYMFIFGFMIAVKSISSNFIIGLYESQNNAVSIVINNRLDGLGSIPSRRKWFYLLHSIQTSSGAHPAFYPIMLKWEEEQLDLNQVEVRNESCK
jgi:hypothetical protein